MKPFFLFFILLITVMEANAAGIGIAPAELNFNLEKGKKQQKELTVYNLENHEVDFNVYSNANFLEFSYNGIVEGNGMEKIIVEANAETHLHNCFKRSFRNKTEPWNSGEGKCASVQNK
jgi:hypothetical protein